MSTTVTYKGQTLTTVENQTRTLQTAGKYLEGDIILTDETGGGGGVETNTVSNLYASVALYYTDASMRAQTATEIVSEDLPVGTLIVVYNQGPAAPMQPSGVTQLASYGSVAKGQYIIYAVSPVLHEGGGND